jgi:integrase
LSDRARAIILEMEKVRAGAIQAGAFVFPAGPSGAAYSNTALLMLLRRLGRGDLTAHGFRSTFRDWAAERTNYPREVCEQALAHAIDDKVEAAYRRGDLFEKRRRLMGGWAKWCASRPPAGEVVALANRAT